MKRNLLTTIIALAVAMAAKAEAGSSYYVYLANGEVMAYPKEYVKAIDNDDNEHRVTLVNDSIVRWQKTEIDSISTVSPHYPRFTFFEFNDKHNDQLFDDVEAGIIGDNVKATIGAIGKWLTPTFEMDSEDAVAYVDGKKQISEQSRVRFNNDVIYTLSRKGYQRLSIEKVSDEVWSSAEETATEIRLTADMLSTNAPTSQEGEGLDMMLDNNTATFFHSTWSADKVYEVDLTKQVYLQVELPKAVSNFRFHFVGRPNTERYNIKKWKIEASNDGKQWIEVSTVDEGDGLPTTGNGVSYTSPTVKMGADYSKLRFTAVEVGYKNYLCLAEFKLYEMTGGGEPELLQPARYDYRMVPLGREMTVAVDWLTDRAASVPRIDIDIEGGEMVSSKDYYLNAAISIQGFGVWPDFKDSVQIKGRGNTSWNEGKPFAKNPYRLKFSSSVKPFGMTKGKNWNLIAQAQTGSMLSNPVALKIARVVGTAASNDVIPVELYMNGDYRGSYYFTQKVGLANNSVDIDETAGVLLEMDHYFDETYKFKSAKYALPTNIKDPDFSDEETMITMEQVQSTFNTFENAIYNNTNFERFTDIDMLIRFMLVNELVMNTELGHPKSSYLYRENINHMSSKYTFGPVWDFDWSYNYESNRLYCVGGETADFLSYHTSRPGHKLFKQLWQASSKVKYEYAMLWKQFSENQLQEIIDYIDDYYAFANLSFKNNATKWSDGANYGTNVANMKAWIAKRAAHLASKYNPSSLTPPQSTGITPEQLASLIINQGNATDSEADINADGKVSISDVAWLCNNTNQREEPIDPSVMDNGGSNEIDMTLTQGETANVWHLDVDMNNGCPFIAMNFCLNLPKGIIVKGASSGITTGDRLAFAHTLAVAENKDNNQWQMIAYSPYNDYIPSTTGNLLSVTLTTDHNATAGNQTLSLSDIIAVNGNGIEQQLASTNITLNITETGINNVTTSDCRITYFTPDGKQLDKPRSGVTICRKVYSDGRVEVKKINL